MHRNHELPADEEVTTTQGVAWGYNDRPYYGAEMPDGMGELFSYDKAALAGWLRRAADAVDALRTPKFAVQSSRWILRSRAGLDSYEAATRWIDERVAAGVGTYDDYEVQAWAGGVEMRKA